MRHILLVLALAVVPAAATPASAQELAANGSEAGLTGTLPNGLAYHIERVASANREISLRLIVRVGAVQGLPEIQASHVLEHIVISKLQDIETKGGLRDRRTRLGASINATTGENYTTYYINLAASRPDSSEEALQILMDWVTAGAPTDEEVDRERKAVIEEIRRGPSDSQRMIDLRRQRIIMPDNPLVLAEPDRVGSINVSAETVRAIHGRYYVPSNMALVVSGDIDPEAVLHQIRARAGSSSSSTISQPLASPKQQSLLGGHYLAQGDAESDETVIQVTFKKRPAPPGTAAHVRELALLRVIQPIFGDALAALGERTGAPLSGGLELTGAPANASASGADFVKLHLVVGRRGATEGLRTLLSLVETLRQRGVSNTLLASAKASLTNVSANPPTARDIAGRWTQFFAEGAFHPGEAEVRAEVAKLTNEDVATSLRIWLDPAHRDIFIDYPAADAASIPIKAELPRLIRQAERAAPVDYAPPAVRTPAVSQISLASAPDLAATQEAAGYRRWTLPHSRATLLFRRTDDEIIRIVGLRSVVASRLRAEDAMSAKTASEIVNSSGLGGLGGHELARYLASRNMTLSAAAATPRERISASGPTVTWAELLSLFRARMVEPQCRADVYRRYAEGQRDLLDRTGPTADEDAFQRLIESATGSKWRPDRGDLKRLSYPALCAVDTRIFGDAASMTIAVEGNLSEEDMLAGVVAAIDIPRPDRPAAVSDRPRQIWPAETSAGRTVIRRGTRQLARVSLVIISRSEAPAAPLLTEIIQNRIFTRLRTIEKGSYAPLAGVFQLDGALGARFDVAFDCAPENVDRLIAAAVEEVDRLGEDGPTDEELDMVRTSNMRSVSSASEAAEAWSDRESLVDRPQPTNTEVRDWSRAFFRSSRLRQFILLPKQD